MKKLCQSELLEIILEDIDIASLVKCSIISGERFIVKSTELLYSSRDYIFVLSIREYSRKLVELSKIYPSAVSTSQLSEYLSHIYDKLSTEKDLQALLVSSWILHSRSYYYLRLGRINDCLALIKIACNNDLKLISEHGLYFFLDSVLMLIGRRISLLAQTSIELQRDESREIIALLESLHVSFLDNSNNFDNIGEELRILSSRIVNPLFFSVTSFKSMPALSELYYRVAFFYGEALKSAGENSDRIVKLLIDGAVNNAFYDYSFYISIRNSLSPCLSFWYAPLRQVLSEANYGMLLDGDLFADQFLTVKPKILMLKDYHIDTMAKKSLLSLLDAKINKKPSP